MKKFKWLAVLAAMIMVLAFAGCSDSSSSDDDDETSSALPDWSKAAVGDIVLTDGTFVKPENFTADMTAAAVIVRAKSGDTPALGVGIHRKTGAWCTTGANAYSVNITDLQTSKCTDGSNAWETLKEALGTDDDTSESSKYPAWNFCNTYGTTNNLTGALEEGWYLPAIAELKTIYTNKDTINPSLATAGGDQFSGWYWSCCQYSSNSNHAYGLSFTNCNTVNYGKYSITYVCSVRAFN